MSYRYWHPSHASGNTSGTSVILGIIGFAINPLLGVVGALIGDGIHNCFNKQPPHEIPFWAKPDSGVNSFRKKI